MDRTLFRIFLAFAVSLFSYLYLWVPFATALSNNGSLIFTLDDSYIHLAFAKTFAESGTFGIRPGIPVGGSTAPLWTLWLAPAFWLGIVPEVWMYFWSTLFTFLSFFLLYRFAREVGMERGLSLALVIAYGTYYSSYLSTQSGMEIPMANAVMLLLFIFLERGGQPILLGLLVGILGLLRPEFYLLGGLVFLQLLYERKLKWTFFLAPLSLLVPYHLWLLKVNGFLLPTTFYAKVPTLLTRQLPTEYIAALSAFLFQYAGLLPLLIPAGFYILLRRQNRVPAAWAIALIGWYAFTGKSGLWTPTYLGNFGRYIMIVVPVLFLAGFLPLSFGYRLYKGKIQRWLVPAATVLLLLLIFMIIPITLGNYTKCAEDMMLGDVRVARWVSANLPEEATLLVHDVGAMAYYTTNPLIDVVGITTPAALPHRKKGRLAQYAFEMRPDYMIFIKDWGGFLGPRLRELTPIQVFTIPNTILYSSDEIIVYRTPWTREEWP